MDNDGWDLPSWWVAVELLIIFSAVSVGLYFVLKG